MHLTAIHGHDEALLVLLSRLSHTNILDKNGRSALHLAAANGHTNVAILLISRGSLVSLHDSTSEKMTSVHYAARNGHEKVLLSLLENTEDFNVLDARDYAGQTALMLAVANGHVSTAELLIRNGSNVEAFDHRRRTALFKAVSSVTF